MADLAERLDLDALAATLDRDGYVVIPGLFDDGEMDLLQAAMVALQEAITSGTLDRRYAGDEYLAEFDGDVPPYCHYVAGVTRLSPVADAAFSHPVILDLCRRILGDAIWEFDINGRGTVYQDARPGPGMTYTRIGWHCDHQSRPTSSFWPGMAVTIHLDATSPANGFLRVVPGSHKGGTDGMPLGFEKVPGEVAVYCERGDVILHHCDLWHSAARATDDPPAGVRRHVRGSFMGGPRPEPGAPLEPFNKNAAR